MLTSVYIIYIYIYYIYIYIYIYVYNKANDSKKVHLFYIKFRILILIIHIINRYLKSVFTVNLFQDLFSSVKFPQYKSFCHFDSSSYDSKTISSSLYEIPFYISKVHNIYFHY